MNIEEAYYFGQCVLNCICDKDSDNGKTVSATNGTRSFTGTVVDKKCTLIVPGKIIGNNNEYTVSLLNGGTAEFSTKIDVGFGDFVDVHMAAGYEPIYKNKSLATLEDVAANTNAGMVVDALAVKELNGNLKANGKDFIFDYQNGDFGWNESSSRGADTFHPFKSKHILITPDDEFSGSSKNIDIKPYTDRWDKLTNDNFFIVNASITDANFTWQTNHIKSNSIDYNASTGILNVSIISPRNCRSSAQIMIIM